MEKVTICGLMGKKTNMSMLLKVSAKWANKVIDCPCQDHSCCNQCYFVEHGPNEKVPCPNLGTNGCVLERKDRPILCLIYPFSIVHNVIVLHMRGVYNQRLCKPVVGKGEKTIFELNYQNFEIVFGKVSSEKIRAKVSVGKDAMFEASRETLDRIRYEIKCKNEKVIPKARGGKN